jgi:hypothetical protein
VQAGSAWRMTFWGQGCGGAIGKGSDSHSGRAWGG